MPGPDCLRYVEWAQNQYANDPDVFTVAAYNKHKAHRDHYRAVQRNSWFVPWGWGTWRDRWEEMSEHWPFNEYDSWDLCINRLRGQRVQMEPLLARCQNIGAEDGTHCPSAEWHAENHYNSFGSWSVAPKELEGCFFELPKIHHLKSDS